MKTISLFILVLLFTELGCKSDTTSFDSNQGLKDTMSFKSDRELKVSTSFKSNRKLKDTTSFKSDQESNDDTPFKSNRKLKDTTSFNSNQDLKDTTSFKSYQELKNTIQKDESYLVYLANKKNAFDRIFYMTCNFKQLRDPNIHEQLMENVKTFEDYRNNMIKLGIDTGCFNAFDRYWRSEALVRIKYKRELKALSGSLGRFE